MNLQDKVQIALFERINSDKNTFITGIESHQFLTLFDLFQSNKLNKSAFIVQSAEEAEQLSQLINKDSNTYVFPTNDLDIYSSVFPEIQLINEQHSIISSIIAGSVTNIILTIESLTQFFPPIDFFKSGNIKIAKDDIYDPEELAKSLIELGYSHSHSVEEPGTFARKGEIFDIYPSNLYPIRLIYFDELIEEIFKIDPDTNKTLKDEVISEFELESTIKSVLNQESISKFKTHFPRPSHSDKEAYQYRKDIFNKLSNNIFFDELPIFINYFFDNTTPLHKYLDGFNFILFNSISCSQKLEQLRDINLENYNVLDGSDTNKLKPHPTKLFDYNFTFDDLNHTKVDPLSINIEDNDNTIHIDIEGFSSNGNKTQRIDYILKKLQKNKNFDLHIFFTDIKFKDEFSYLLETKNLNNNFRSINYSQKSLKHGFIYKNENLIVVSQYDIYGKKAKKHRKVTDQSDLFAETFSSIQIGDFLIHKEHGIGKYLGIETLNLNGTESDFIIIEYKDQDKVYIPVYKMSSVQKYATATSHVSLANLKTKKFDLAKAKAAKAIKKLAFSLLELHAKRKLKESHSFSCPEHEINDFELSFKFEETPDQKQAIEDVYADLKRKQPMDRLVCGDVGFGKTEVAMRASYAAVLDSKQVCILVPTTVLALQHYQSFKERFKDFPVNIDFLSRFKSAAQSKVTIENLKDGKIDILVGTHKILSDKIKFKDLGLIVIDEEQRFGVAHKEKLKLLKETVDTLLLTATPIPRTLQMSFLGIKDLSLIKSPPPRRQSIKTYLVKEDPNTIKLAIEKELNRNGQVFIVHNKVSDIEIFTSKIRSLAPKAKITYAHGQMTEKELEKKITSFYKHEFDILISTTIIESGIDIPNANTMIIDRADMYGLSQLHQLRGRIGRSDKKAYAYFTIPKNQNLSEIAAKRLKAITQYSDIGSGFSLATSDLEIRGSGDILGPEQSGHINDIGLELYMELLEETINQIKGINTTHFIEIEILTPFPSFIPKDYIEDSSARLKYYKKISNSRSIKMIESYTEEIEDQFGSLPPEVLNLLSILKIRVMLQGLGIYKIKVSAHSAILYFNDQELNQDNALRDKVLEIFMKRPKIYKINPDFSINCKFKDRIEINNLLEFAEFISKQFKDV